MSLPKEFIEIAEDAFGREVASELCKELLSAEQTVAIRTNPHKLNTPYDQADESHSAPEAGNVPWCSNGIYLANRPSFTFDPMFHAGAYYVQDPSAMYMEMALEAAGFTTEESLENLKVLDLCAAPGGKSTHLLSLLPSSSLLVSNEVINSRATILAENIAKWGCDNVVLTNSDPACFSQLKGWFDIIVVDAPCSGEGMFRKDPNAVKEWSLANVKLCSERQQRILSDIWPALAQGGVLIYSTCTFNRYENDGISDFMVQHLGAERVSLSNLMKKYPQLYQTKSEGCQFIPGRVDGEGQFLAVVKKPLKESNSCSLLPDNNSVSFRSGCSRDERRDRAQKMQSKNRFMKKGGSSINSCDIPAFLKQFAAGGRYIFSAKSDIIKIIPTVHRAAIGELESRLKVILSGRAVANSFGAPAADLALSANISQIDLPKVELSKDEAIKFLQREPLIFADSPKGYLLLTYKGLGLGFVKNLGNRSNSLLPMNRRILKRIAE